MSLSSRWFRQPQKVWLRRALFQIHLWTGIAAGLYILVVSVTGSAVVFRNEIYLHLDTPPILVTPVGEHLPREALNEAVAAQHPGFRVRTVFSQRNPNRAIEIWLARDGEERQRLFDPYTGEDLGRSVSIPIEITSWLLDLHVNLLAGETGRFVNGLGAGLLVLLCLTGAVIWWPGAASWTRSLWFGFRSGWKRTNWELHSALGFWTFLLILMWGVTGVIVTYPETWSAFVDYVEPYPDFEDLPEDYRFERRLGDQAFRWIARAHFGTFGGTWIKGLWVVLGLVPAVLFATGALMWWNRVPGPRLARGRAARAR